MKKIILLIIASIILLGLLFFPEIKTEGSTFCEFDSDCIPSGMCHYGCYSNIPSEFSGFAYPTKDCGMRPPENCVCNNNICQVKR